MQNALSIRRERNRVLTLLALLAGLVAAILLMNGCTAVTPAVQRTQQVSQAVADTATQVNATNPQHPLLGTQTIGQTNAAIQQVAPAVVTANNNVVAATQPADKVAAGLTGAGQVAQATAPLLPDPYKEYAIIAAILLPALASIFSSHKTVQNAVSSLATSVPASTLPPKP